VTSIYVVSYDPISYAIMRIEHLIKCAKVPL